MGGWSDDDIIVAPATPLGEGAIGIVRLSGAGCVELVERIFQPRTPGLRLTRVASHSVHLGYIIGEEPGLVLDEVLVCVMRAPRTYTREDVVEIYCHGGLVPVRRVLERVLGCGARFAEPGEFTKRAVLNGRIDLAQAEAVLDVVRARSHRGLQLALAQLRGSLSERVESLMRSLRRLLAEMEACIDFPEDVGEEAAERWEEAIAGLISEVASLVAGGHEGRLYREGLLVALVGRPNTGKSTLLNALLGEERALVSEVPGTTRDLIEETLVVRGVPLRLVDTAGLRKSAGYVESLGIARARAVAERADLLLVVLDGESRLTDEDREILGLLRNKKGVVIINKIDSPGRCLAADEVLAWAEGAPVVEISARERWGLSLLEEKIWEVIGRGVAGGEPVVVTRARHLRALEEARSALEAAVAALREGLPLECVALDLREAWRLVGTITGETCPEAVVEEVFREFCVGK